MNATDILTLTALLALACAPTLWYVTRLVRALHACPRANTTAPASEPYERAQRAAARLAQARSVARTSVRTTRA